MRKDNMFQKLFVLVAFCISVTTVSAQSSYGNSTYFEVNPVFGVDKGNDNIGLDLKFGKNWELNEVVSWGLSVGISEDLHFNTWKPAIPIMFRGIFDMNQKESSPFFMIDFGYSINTAELKYGSLIINPAIGYRFKNYYIGAGYMAGVGLYEGGGTSSSINIRIGRYLRTGNLKAPRWLSFFKKTFVTLELGGGLSLSKYGYYEGKFNSTGEEDRSNVNAVLNLNWLYEINDNWTAGIGTGARYYIHKRNFKDSKFDDYYDENEYTVTVPVYLKAQYKFDEVVSDIRPFVACDAGINIGTESDTGTCFHFESQAGIWYKDKFSLSIGYEPNAPYWNWLEDDEKETFKQLSVRLGVKF